MIVILLSARARVYSNCSSTPQKNSIVFFVVPWRRFPPHPMSVLGLKPTSREENETAFEINRHARRRAVRAGVGRDGNAGERGGILPPGRHFRNAFLQLRNPG